MRLSCRAAPASASMSVSCARTAGSRSRASFSSQGSGAICCHSGCAMNGWVEPSQAIRMPAGRPATAP